MPAVLSKFDANFQIASSLSDEREKSITFVKDKQPADVPGIKGDWERKNTNVKRKRIEISKIRTRSGRDPTDIHNKDHGETRINQDKFVTKQNNHGSMETSRDIVNRNRSDFEDTRSKRDNEIDSIDKDSLHRTRSESERADPNNLNRTSGEIRTHQSSMRDQADTENTAMIDSEKDNFLKRTQNNAGQNKRSFTDSLGIILFNPKYRQYATADSRLQSYKKWPKNKKVSVSALVNAGFAYTGVDDSVRCFCCGGALRDWPDDTDPWIEHALKFPHCGHLRQCRGDSYIKHVRGEGEGDYEIDSDGDNVLGWVELGMKRNRDAVMAARDFCTDESLLRCGIKRLLLEKDTFSAVDLVKVTEQIKEEIEEQEESAKLSEAKSLGNKVLCKSEQVAGSDFEIMEEHRKLKDPVMCKICFNSFACIITLPCGHLVSCSQCIAALTTCAICRAQIKGTVRALMAV